MIRLLPTLLCLALLAPAATAASHKYALLVGVRKYDRSQLAPLEYSENDVRVLAQLFRSADYRRVVLLTQTDGADEPRYLPTAAAIRREIRALFEKRQPGDTVVLAFSGQGIQFTGQDETYFCPADADLKDKKTLIALSEIYRELNRCKAKTKILLCDACRKAPLSTTARGTVGKRVITPRSAGKNKPPQNVIALFSCSAGEVAHESKKLRHGVFFHHVIEGLRGKAARRGDGHVTLSGLVDYVQREVRDFTKEQTNAKTRQRPELVGRSSGVIKLVSLGKIGGQITDPDKLTNQLNEAMKHLKLGQYKKAIALLDQVIKIDPRHAQAYSLRAHALHFVGEENKALADAEKALSLDANLCKPHCSRGLVFAAQGQPKKALAAYTRAIQLNPRFASAYAYRGVVHLDARDLQPALADFNQSLKINPASPFALLQRGLVRGHLKKFNDALADLNKALKLKPKYADAIAARGLIYSQKNEDPRALADFAQALKFNPKLAPAFNYRAKLHHSRKRLGKAIDDFTAAIRLKKDYLSPYFNRAQAFADRGDLDKALADIDVVIKLRPTYAVAYNNRGVYLAAKGQDLKALAEYTRAIELEDKDPLFYRNRARTYLRLKMFDKARHDAQRVELLVSIDDFPFLPNPLKASPPDLKQKQPGKQKKQKQKDR